MPSDSLSLFPNPTSERPPTSSLKPPAKPARVASPATVHHPATKSEPLRGLALHLGPRHAEAVLLEPGQNHPDHSLFCEPGLPPSEISVTQIQAEDTPPFAVRISETSSTEPVRTMHSTRPPALPARTASSPSVRSKSPMPLQRTGSSTRPSPSSRHPDSVPKESQIQSIFPEYDHSLPLSHQSYYPSPEAPTTTRRPTSASRRPSLRLATSDTTQPFDAPIAGLPVLETLWNAATGKPHNKRAKNVRLAMHREISNTDKSNDVVEIGFSNFYFFTRRSIKTSRAEKTSAEILARRHHPSKDITLPIAALELDQAAMDNEEAHHHQCLATTIFPQTAAIAALETAAMSPDAASISQYDPNASSPQAAQLAFAAVAEAKQAEQSHIMYTTQTNQFGFPENKYSLRHPRLGELDMTIEGDINLFAESMPTSAARSRRISSYEKITIHLPIPSSVLSSHSATSRQPLATLDFSAGILDISLEALGTLNSKYILDTAVCALMTVAFMESDKPRKYGRSDTPYFSGPPRLVPKQRGHTKSGAGRVSRVRGWRNSFKSGGRVRGDLEKPLPPLPVKSESASEKMPFVTRALLKLLGLSSEAIVWLLGLGFKALAKVLMGIGKAFT